MQHADNDLEKSPAYLENVEEGKEIAKIGIIKGLLLQKCSIDFIAQIAEMSHNKILSIQQNLKIEAMAASYKTDVIEKPKYRTLVKMGNKVLVRAQINSNRFGIDVTKGPFYLEGAENTKTIVTMQLLIR
jgi:hypothetical protein